MLCQKKNAKRQITLLKEEFEPEGFEVFPISAVTGEGVNELLWRVNQLLKELPLETTEFETEYFIDDQDDPEERFSYTIMKKMVFMTWKVHAFRECSDIRIWNRNADLTFSRNS